MRTLVIVPFLNEARHMGTFLKSLEEQTRRPDRAVLVDDGSTDGSEAIAEAFADRHDWVEYRRRPPRPPERDRLATAAELKAFHWGLAQVDEPWDVLVKMDADLKLSPVHFETVLAAMAADLRLGICGAFLAYRGSDGSPVREGHPGDHVRGPTKFYRRACYEQIGPLPEILGWDGMDDVKARLYGWEARSVPLVGGDSIHLRPTGLHDGALRANRRWGLCAYAYGAHPLWAILSGLVRAKERPYLLRGLNFVYGYFAAAATNVARAESAVVRQTQLEERRRIEAVLHAKLPRF